MTSESLAFNLSQTPIPNGSDISLDAFWFMPFSASIIAIVYLAFNIAVGTAANCLLIIIINYSPTLKTPANSHLINICANNLVLCFCMVLSLISILLPTDFKGKINILAGFHIFLTSNCFLQYLGTFASIGYYRSKIIRTPSLVIKRRRQIITRCLATSWATSVIVSLMICLSLIENDVYACSTVNPFQKEFLACDGEIKLSSQRIGIVVVNITVFCIILVIIISSYHKVFKALNKGNPFGRNRVLPISRSLSLPSEVGDMINNGGIAHTANGTENGGNPDRTIYSVSRKEVSTNGEITVHYQRNDSINMLTFEDIIALENPILATHMRRQVMQRRPLQLTRSNTSNTSVMSKCPDFTDISASADLQRYQNMKNKSALRNLFLRRDRVGLNSATRNSLVMLASFAVCSLPMFICTIPTILSNVSEYHRILILMFTQLAFCLNAIINPLWYLIQNKRVRKCLLRVAETLCVKLDIRR